MLGGLGRSNYFGGQVRSGDDVRLRLGWQMSSSLDHELHATSRGALNGGAFHATVGCEMIVPRPIYRV